MGNLPAGGGVSCLFPGYFAGNCASCLCAGNRADRSTFRRDFGTGGSFLQKTKRHPALRLALAVLGAALLLLPTARAAQPPGETRYVVPVGSAVGIKLLSDGVLVVGFTDVATAGGPANPARQAGLKEGDVITRLDGRAVSTIEEVQDILQEEGARTVDLRVRRDGEERDLTIRAVQCAADGAWKLGAWIRDSMAGIGTLTFVDPETGLFGTLGHGVNDVDTAVLLELQSGAITPASVAGVVKGEDGRPGELRGAFPGEEDLGPSSPTRSRGSSGISRTNPVSPGPRCRWRRRTRSIPARPPSWPTSPGPRWRSMTWRSSRSSTTPPTPGT